MSEIEKMNRYIKRTGMPEKLTNKYDIRMSEWKSLLCSGDVCNAIGLAFSYGQAKGYRAAKAEARCGEID